MNIRNEFVCMLSFSSGPTIELWVNLHSQSEILFFEAAFFKLGILNIVWTAQRIAQCRSERQLQVQHHTHACDVFQQYIIVTHAQ